MCRLTVFCKGSLPGVNQWGWRLLADYVNWLFFFLLVYLSVCLKKDTGGITDLCFENRGQDWWGFLMGKEKWSQREGNTDRPAEPGPSTSPQAWRRASRTRSPTPVSALLFCTVRSAQSCPALCHTLDCGPPGSSVHGILQARILEWAATSSAGGSSWPRDPTRTSSVSCTGRRVLHHKRDAVLESLALAQALQPLAG